jgi:transcription-repair coupling factor (superfamily II helicase)
MIHSTLADRYAELKQAQEVLDNEISRLRAEILALGADVVDGDAATVTVALSERTSVDRAAVAKLLTAEQLASVTRVTQVESLRWKAKLKVAA